MSDLVAAFLSQHGVNVDWWPWGRALLAAFLDGRGAFSDAMATVSEEVLEKEPSFGLLSQLSERAAEHIAGSIACFATKNAASAEVVARAAFETSVNIRFMLSGDRNSRVVAWIRHYVLEDNKQIDGWEKALAHLSVAEQQVCVPRIATRRKVHELRKEWLTGAETEFAQFGSLNLREPWPRIIGRFEQIGEAVAYRTAYARLSSQTHADAEDTLNYIFWSDIGGEESISQMAEETVAFTQYLMGYSTYFYLSALKGLCDAFSLKATPNLDAAVAKVFDGMQEIADAWKW